MKTIKKPAMYRQATTYLTTVCDVLRFAVSCFNQAHLTYGHGTQNAHDEAAYLILSALNLPVDQLTPFLAAKLLPQEIQRLVEYIRLRTEEHVPVAYLTHEAWQGPFSFYVDERVLVPRSFVYELLGEPLLPWISDPDTVQRALDLCTGSGCLAIQLAHHYPAAQIDAVDISIDALEVAAMNVQNYGLEGRVRLVHTDMFEGLEGEYNLIIANPPYISAGSMSQLPAEYLHEPKLALESGKDGLDATRMILQHAQDYLTANGILLVEVGQNREALEQAFPSLPFMWLETQSSNDYVFLLTKAELLAGFGGYTQSISS